MTRRLRAATVLSRKGMERDGGERAGDGKGAVSSLPVLSPVGRQKPLVLAQMGRQKPVEADG